jgi:glycolate oxidase iron-sulfur subunit
MTRPAHPSSNLPLDPRTFKQAQTCVHCGLCLPACPTYLTTGDENDSPRGRIFLMKSMAEGRTEPTGPALKHLDLCLDCRACETACPSGVVYHELIEESRALLAPQRKLDRSQRLVDWVSRHVLPYPTRVKLSMLPARLLQRVGLFKPMSRLLAKVLGPSVAKMNDMLPATGPLWPSPLAAFYPAKKTELTTETQRNTEGHGDESKNAPSASSASPRLCARSAPTVGMFAGCVGSVLFQETNRKTIALLNHLGCDVIVPPAQVCCGAMHHHGGDPRKAAEFAKANIEAFAVADVVVNNIAGCGAMLKEYDHLLRDDPRWSARAAQFAHKQRDISQLIAELNPPPPEGRIDKTVVYHDACHLAHGQKITVQPRQLLAMIPGLKLIPLPESDTCCGAAGTYNLQQPAMARQLAERKLANIAATGATLCATGNVGCAMQIQSEAHRIGMDLTVVHPVDLLYEAYLGK